MARGQAEEGYPLNHQSSGPQAGTGDFLKFTSVEIADRGVYRIDGDDVISARMGVKESPPIGKVNCHARVGHRRIIPDVEKLVCGEDAR